MVKNKGLVAEAYEWDEEEVSSDDNEIVKVKVLMALDDDENIVFGKKSVRNGEWVKISMRKVHTLLDMEDNDDRKYFLDYLILPAESQVNTTDPLVAVTDSSATKYDSADESSVCNIPIPPLEKLAAEALKGVTINEPPSAPAKDKSLASKSNLAPAGKLKNVKTEIDLPLAIPLLLGRPFLRTSRAFIDVYGKEITLSGNPTSTDPIIATSFPSLTPYEGGDFILEEIENYLSNGSIPPGIDDDDFDPEGDICLIEKFLNNDPFQLPPMDLKQVK
ncbi:hypothetical protein Tco_0861563 [Tanacetum coccineum]|uniref:Retrovirus-related Pol polyprotein from transposon TNT 1-94 n=1 Tax=Tanacetum coccineum TaxID=301880 RepID=A0ABQ5BLF8_9ASTR